MYFFYAAIYPSQGFLKGSGCAAFVLIASVVIQYFVKIPLAYVLSHMTPLGLRGIALAWVLTPIVPSIVYYFYISKGRWKKHWNLTLEDKDVN